MSVVLKNLYNIEEKEFTSDNILDSAFSIFSKIINHTKNLENKTSSVFDHRHKAGHLTQEIQDSPQSQYLDTSGSDSTSEEEHCCILDDLSIENFVILCYKSLGLDDHMLILSMMYFDKILAKKFILTENNIHKVFFICMMEVHKFYSDVVFPNKDYAKLCGISTEELLELELEFLNYLDFNMNISEDDFFAYKKKLKNYFEKFIIFERKYLE